MTGKKGLAEVGAKGVKAVISESAGEIFMHALGYIDPGTLARRIVGLDAELRRQDSRSKSMTDQLNKQLEDKTVKLQSDKKVLHGGA